MMESLIKTEPLYNISYAKESPGIYFDYISDMHTTAANWEIAIYLNVSIYQAHYLQIKHFQNETLELCNKATESFSNECTFLCLKNKFYTAGICSLFKNTSEKVLNEFEFETNKLVQIIEEQDHSKHKRDVTNSIKEMIYTLFGSIKMDDVYKLYSNIRTMIKSGQKFQNLAESKLIITPANTNDAIMINKPTIDATTEIQNNIRQIRRFILSEREEFSDENIKIILENQILNLKLIYNQYALEIGKIIQILHSAMYGKLHPLVISSNQLLDEIKLIKLNLSPDLNIPVKLDVSGMSELYRIMQTTIVKSDDLIIFINTIPLVLSNMYKLYNVLPNPVYLENNRFMFIQPRFKFIAITIDQEYFINLSENDVSLCTDTNRFKICKNFLAKRVVTSNECEINLISYSDITELTDFCKIKYTSFKHGIFHKLMSSNSWIFTVTNQNLVLTCYNKDSITEVITGSGILSLSEQCSAISGGYRMIPFRTIYSELKSDFIPTMNLTKYVHNVNTIKEFVSPEIVFSKYKDDNEVTIPKDNLDYKQSSIYINYYIIGLIILCCLLIIILLIIIIRKIFNFKKIKNVNVNQPSSTEPNEQNKVELKIRKGKSLPKIIV